MLALRRAGFRGRLRRAIGGWLAPSATLGRAPAGLVHDLGKPLGTVEQLALRLQQRAREPALVQSDARTIAALAGEMRACLRGLLGEPERDAGAAGETRLDALVERAIRRVAPGREAARVAVRLAPGLPRLRSGGDELVRVLANLVDNALRASAPGDGVSVIGVEAAAGLCVEVSDRGCGMDAGTAARAFEPFFTTRGASEGSGLGLAICRDLVAGLGGSIELDSAPGAGTRVRLTLPLPRRARNPLFQQMKKNPPGA